MKIKDTCTIKIERDNKKLLLIESSHYPHEERFHLKYDIDLIAKDQDYIFTFYGENGSGKSSICDKITGYQEQRSQSEIKKEWITPNKIIDINYLLGNDFTSVALNQRIKNGDDGVYFHSLFKNSNISESMSLTYNYFFFCSNDAEKNINKYNRLNNKIFDWWFKNCGSNRIKDYSIMKYYEHDDYTDDNPKYHTKKSAIYILIKIIEEHLIKNRIPLNVFLDNCLNYIDDLKKSDDSCLVDILFEEQIRIEIIDFYVSFLKNININSSRNAIKYNNKILDFIEKNYNEDFKSISKSIFYKIDSNLEYSSFLNINYKRAYILEFHQNNSHTYKIEDFLKKISEGQKKIFKWIFILAKIKIMADNKTIIIADDIFESFDNKNMINVMIAFYKIIKIRKPMLMFFSHDFEIFGLFNKILKVGKGSSFIISRNKKNLTIEPFSIKNMTLEEYIENKNPEKSPIQIKVLYFLVSCIYGRNLVERTLGQKNIYYEKLTSLLHIKINSKETLSKAHEISSLKFLDSFSNEDIQEIENFAKKFSSYYYMVRNIFNFTKTVNIGKIELNIFLSLYGRLCIEQKILKKLSKNVKERNLLLSKITTYQTGYLLNKYGSDVDINILNDYITKFIHINQGLSYLINIDSEYIYKLINNIK